MLLQIEKITAMREILSDLPNDTCAKLWDAIGYGDLNEIGRLVYGPSFKRVNEVTEEAEGKENRNANHVDAEIKRMKEEAA